jgi:hypothetical protein
VFIDYTQTAPERTKPQSNQRGLYVRAPTSI